MQVIKDIISFIGTLSLVDIIFFFAVLALMLLVITLIYFIKENNEVEEQVIIENKSTTEMDNLKEITNAILEAEPPAINLNNYEEEQEEKAIISYEELIKRKNDFAINYSEEENIDEELTVKKVDLDNLLNKEIEVNPEIKVTVISYEKEEAFLEALKTLQQKLN